MNPAPIATLGDCVLRVSEIYVRDGKRYFLDPITGVEREDDAQRWQARIDESGNLIPLTDAERQILKSRVEEAFHE